MPIFEIFDSPKLIGGIYLAPFDSNSAEPNYIVKIENGRTWQISSTLYHLMALMNGSRTIKEISEALSLHTLQTYSTDDINVIIKQYLMPLGLIAIQNSEKREYKKANGKLILSIPLINANILQPVTNILSKIFGLIRLSQREIA